MNKVKIIIDSCSDMPAEVYAEHDLDLVYESVTFGEELYRDGQDITIEQLFAKIDETKTIPHTSAVPPAQFEEKFEKYINEGYDIVVITLGDKLSSSYQNAHIASMNFPEDRIYQVNTHSLSTGIGLIGLKAAKLRDEGLSAKEIAEKCQEYSEKVVAQFCVDTLEYLYKGGRLSKAAAVIGTLLHIHPYIYVTDGVLKVYKKPRGPMRMAIKEELAELAKDIKESGVDPDWIMITTSRAPEDMIEYTRQEILKLLPNANIMVTLAGCVISSHCGPGTLGILYIKEK